MIKNWMIHQTILPQNKRLNLKLHWFEHDNDTVMLPLLIYQNLICDVKVVIRAQVMFIKPCHRCGFTGFVVNNVAGSIDCFQIYLLLAYQTSHNLQPLIFDQVCITIDHLAILSVGLQLWCTTFLIMVLSPPLAFLQRFLGNLSGAGQTGNVMNIGNPFVD